MAVTGRQCGIQQHLVQSLARLRVRRPVIALLAAAENMPAPQRRTAHAAIESQLDGIDADVLARLGVA